MDQVNLNQLAAEFLKIEDQKVMKDFLAAILTPQELEQLPVRLEIIRRLKKGEAQHKIAEDLGIGIATVTRGSRMLKEGRFQNV
ncbi:Trp family transcriptional regulator [Patescibacteria group bacterium]